jgi:hypothetical protein
MILASTVNELQTLLACFSSFSFLRVFLIVFIASFSGAFYHIVFNFFWNHYMILRIINLKFFALGIFCKQMRQKEQITICYYLLS